MANDGGELQSIKREVSSSGLVKMLNFIKKIHPLVQKRLKGVTNKHMMSYANLIKPECGLHYQDQLVNTVKGSNCIYLSTTWNIYIYIYIYIYYMGRPKFFNFKAGSTYSYHCSIMVKRTYFYQNNEHSCEGVRSPELAVCIFIVTTTFLNPCNLGFMKKQWT